jgi:antitoxin (DNA-binding transcriptional repressor) of toxin-antitoxin stability system
MRSSKKRPRLRLTGEQRRYLTDLTEAKETPRRQAERAAMLLAWADGETISGIAQRLERSWATVQKVIDVAIDQGLDEALQTYRRPGRTTITAEARRWLADVSASPPSDGTSWSKRRLTHHARVHGPAAGHPSLARLSEGSTRRILQEAGVVLGQDPVCEPKGGEPLTARDVEARLSHLAAEGPVLITRAGKPVAVLLPVPKDVDPEVLALSNDSTLWKLYDEALSRAKEEGCVALDEVFESA